MLDKLIRLLLCPTIHEQKGSFWKGRSITPTCLNMERFGFIPHIIRKNPRKTAGSALCLYPVLSCSKSPPGPVTTCLKTFSSYSEPKQRTRILTMWYKTRHQALRTFSGSSIVSSTLYMLSHSTLTISSKINTVVIHMLPREKSRSREVTCLAQG